MSSVADVKLFITHNYYESLINITTAAFRYSHKYYEEEILIIEYIKLFLELLFELSSLYALYVTLANK